MKIRIRLDWAFHLVLSCNILKFLHAFPYRNTHDLSKRTIKIAWRNSSLLTNSSKPPFIDKSSFLTFRSTIILLITFTGSWLFPTKILSSNLHLLHIRPIPIASRLIFYVAKPNIGSPSKACRVSRSTSIPGGLDSIEERRVESEGAVRKVKPTGLVTLERVWTGWTWEFALACWSELISLGMIEMPTFTPTWLEQKFLRTTTSCDPLKLPTLRGFILVL